MRKGKRKKTGRIKDRARKVQRKSSRFFVAFRRSFVQWLIIVGIGLILLACGLFAFSPIIQVRAIRIVRTDARLDIEEVQRTLAPLFSRHLFFLPEYEVKEMLLNNIPAVQEVKVSKIYPSQLFVRITLDPLVAQLHILDPDKAQEETGTGSTIDFLTAKGIYIVAPLLDVPKQLPTVHLVDWAVRPEPGTLLLLPSFLERIAQTERALSQQFGHDVRRRTVFLRAQEYHLRVESGKELWFDLSSPLNQQLLRYRTFLRNVPADEVESIIDLRLTDRVIYK